MLTDKTCVSISLLFVEWLGNQLSHASGHMVTDLTPACWLTFDANNKSAFMHEAQQNLH